MEVTNVGGTSDLQAGHIRCLHVLTRCIADAIANLLLTRCLARVAHVPKNCQRTGRASIISTLSTAKLCNACSEQNALRLHLFASGQGWASLILFGVTSRGQPAKRKACCNNSAPSWTHQTHDAHPRYFPEIMCRPSQNPCVYSGRLGVVGLLLRH